MTAFDGGVEMAKSPKARTADWRDWLTIFVQALAIVTPLVFISTATFQAMSFRYRYGLDYLAIASPTDVLMGAFVAVPVTLAALVLSAPIVYWLWRRSPPVGRVAVLCGAAAGLIATQIVFLSTAASESSGPNGVGPRTGRPTNLRVHPKADVITSCREAPVLWLGSSSAVLNCQGRVTVLHTLDGLTTERVR
ncbi:MAG: hypothetical protein DWQ53_09735 [Microcystis flos-aquae DF17]|nr:MAG: hypothetical protein DWQ53_09735 [Microcystis flos-aquae DF17]